MRVLGITTDIGRSDTVAGRKLGILNDFLKRSDQLRGTVRKVVKDLDRDGDGHWPSCLDAALFDEICIVLHCFNMFYWCHLR